ncbi:MAG: bifunctional hydroxymethylpyrimidine kinase/phosphomethylpyrimidine kinase [Atopococcus tabaci]|uniref:pyridoxal kinase n=1 Tax=Atopococcus tabaci TaxID=269774 RepID=A0AA43ZRR9_9LACT|nr:bifunctional hydroxymethylpyrimidine kinase/phosphomethylpyrimidine kinase [Atopococcus tabaci]
MPKNILIINDIPGAGKVAGNISFPILSAALFEVSILPTLILSKNADYDGGNVVRYSMEQGYEDMLDHWARKQLTFDIYTTGYFADVHQIHEFHKYYLDNHSQGDMRRLYVDPIMGDHGRLYPGFNEGIPQEISKLCQNTYLIMPNVTEACLMTGYEFSESMNEDQLVELAQLLIDQGAENVVLSGIENTEKFGPDQIGFFFYQKDGDCQTIMHRKYHSPFFGTGDIAMSLLIAYHENGLSLKDSLIESGKMLEKCLADTVALERSVQDGIYFEPILLDLALHMRDLQN